MAVLRLFEESQPERKGNREKGRTERRESKAQPGMSFEQLDQAVPEFLLPLGFLAT